jgi:hypothetical protein
MGQSPNYPARLKMNKESASNRWQFRIKDLILLTFIVAFQIAGFGRNNIIYACLWITICIIAFAVNKNLLFRVGLVVSAVAPIAGLIVVQAVKDAMR